MIRHRGVADWALPALAELPARRGRPSPSRCAMTWPRRGGAGSCSTAFGPEGLPVLAYAPLEAFPPPLGPQLSARIG